ncbi:MAG: response regulator [Gammaproteobacteria bacterium SHHR-1]|uniref:ANTAR domain-containing response regulator n=1 Tax=Magnetovirga frankeli TaxID=947516 RepID=UPI00129327D7|nr:response regulator [gamma proteobacterium SS-5]
MTAQAQSELLIADDDPILLGLVAEGLTLAGYRVRQASCGKAALGLCREQAPDLAILDIGMPDLNGIELAEILRRETQVPVLFLTGHGEQIVVDKAMSSAQGMALGYVLKPVKIDSLIPQVQAALELSQHLNGLKCRETQLQDSLSKSHQIDLATGILMERFHLGLSEAEEALRRQARSERRKMADLAAEIIAASDRLKTPLRVQQILLEQEPGGRRRSRS